jgi:hypothetical protein
MWGVPDLYTSDMTRYNYSVTSIGTLHLEVMSQSQFTGRWLVKETNSRGRATQAMAAYR